MRCLCLGLIPKGGTRGGRFVVQVDDDGEAAPLRFQEGKYLPGYASVTHLQLSTFFQSGFSWRKYGGIMIISWRWVICPVMLLALASPGVVLGDESQDRILEMGLSNEDFREGEVPSGWTLRHRFFGPTQNAQAYWVVDSGRPAVKLHSKGALTFLEKQVNIDLREYPIVSWSWKVENVLVEVDESTVAGDDHPIRLFFVFEPDATEQSFWFRLKRFLYLDRLHGHAMGGRFTEYLWSSHLPAGEVLSDPGKPWQKLMVVESGREKLGKWLSYDRNLYRDFKALYGEEPRRLIFIGILNDTDATGQEAVSYISGLRFLKN